MTRILFVCMGNICRSPAGEGVLKHLVRRAGLQDAIVVESAGTLDYHTGELPDERMRTAARRRGIALDSRARQVVARDFERFDLLLAADASNLAHLHRIAPSAEHRGKARLVMEFARSAGAPREVPDPYYGGPAGFEHVLDLLEDACAGLLEEIRRPKTPA